SPEARGRLRDAGPDALPALFAAAGGSILLTAEPSEISLEQRRLALLLAEILVLCRAVGGHSRAFLLYWTHLFELINLKAILRRRLAGEDAAAIRGILLDMGPFAALPVDELLATDSPAEMLRRLERSPFGEIAGRARHLAATPGDFFPLETALDRRFYSGLVAHANEVRSTDRQRFLALLGTLIDGINLVWLLRYRFAYAVPPAETYYLLIDSPFRLSGDTLRKLAALSSAAALLDQLPAPLKRVVAGADTAEQAHLLVASQLAEVADEAILHSPSAFVRAFAYLLRRESDLRLLAGVLRSTRLGLMPELVHAAFPVASRKLHAAA
ncbi:MAG: V-type ATPase subunit, partial [Gallionellaceae bacterium]|nr:V-type ATPase subunit [Gallionellaceae bacterium]